MKKLGYASRSQLQKLHRLGGERNARRVLDDLGDMVCTVRLHENVYYLSKEGRERVGCDRVLKKTNHQLLHHLIRNDLYLAYGCPSTWKQEVKLEVPGVVTVIADALFTKDNRYIICEIDHTQKMQENREKIRKYRQLIDLEGAFKYPPGFVWVTTTEYRKQQLLKLSEGMFVNVYLISDFK